MRKGLILAVIVGVFASTQVTATAATKPVPLGSGTNPWVLVDRAGVTHVVWTRLIPGTNSSELHYRSAAAGANSFSADRVLPVGEGLDSAGPIILQDPAPSNRLIILAERCCSPAGLLALTSGDGGATWSAPTTVFDDQIGAVVASGSGGRPNRAVISPDGILLVYQVISDYKLVQIPLALTPVAKESAVQIGAQPFDAAVTLDELGAPVLAFDDQTTSFFRRGVAGGDISAGTANPIKIAGGPKGVVALLDTGSATSRSLLARKLSGTGLVGSVKLNGPGDRTPKFPHLATDASGRFHAVWVRDNPRRLFYSASSDGARWIAPSLTVRNATKVVDPFVGAGSDGEGWIAWDESAADGQVSAARIDAKTAPVDPGKNFSKKVGATTLTLSASIKCVAKGEKVKPKLTFKSKGRNKASVKSVAFSIAGGAKKTDRKGKSFRASLSVSKFKDATTHPLKAKVSYRRGGAKKLRTKTLTRTFGVCVA